MRNSLKLLFMLVLIFIFSLSCLAKELQADTVKLAPDFKLEDLDQNTFTLSSYKDKQPVILFFWTTWCPSCRGELRTLSDKYPQLMKEGWELLAINIGESVYIVENFLIKHPVNFKVLLDRDMSVGYAYGLLGVPTYVFIDKKNAVRSVRHSFPRGNLKEIISE